MDVKHYTIELLSPLFLALFLSSCATTTVGNPEIFRVGKLEVRLYNDRERMAQDLPSVLALADSLRVGNKQLKVLGYYDSQNQRVYSINDARVLLHELKHYLEPNWRHEIGANYLEALKDGFQSACLDCELSVRELGGDEQGARSREKNSDSEIRSQRSEVTDQRLDVVGRGPLYR